MRGCDCISIKHYLQNQTTVSIWSRFCALLTPDLQLDSQLSQKIAFFSLFLHSVYFLPRKMKRGNKLTLSSDIITNMFENNSFIHSFPSNGLNISYVLGRMTFSLIWFWLIVRTFSHFNVLVLSLGWWQIL